MFHKLNFKPSKTDVYGTIAGIIVAVLCIMLIRYGIAEQHQIEQEGTAAAQSTATLGAQLEELGVALYPTFPPTFTPRVPPTLIPTPTFTPSPTPETTIITLNDCQRVTLQQSSTGISIMVYRNNQGWNQLYCNPKLVHCYHDASVFIDHRRQNITIADGSDQTTITTDWIPLSIETWCSG